MSCPGTSPCVPLLDEVFEAFVDLAFLDKEVSSLSLTRVVRVLYWCDGPRNWMHSEWVWVVPCLCTYTHRFSSWVSIDCNFDLTI